MKQYYRKQLQFPLAEWSRDKEPCNIAVQVISGGVKTHLLDLNKESIAVMREFLDIVEEKL